MAVKKPIPREDAEPVARDVLDLLTDHVDLPEALYNDAGGMIMGRLDVFDKELKDRTTALELAERVLDGIRHAICGAPVFDGDCDPLLEPDVRETFLAKVADRLEVATNREGSDEPREATRYDQIDGLPDWQGPGKESVQAWIDRAENATAPCPICGPGTLILDRSIWSKHRRFAGEGWVCLYHRCTACGIEISCGVKTKASRLDWETQAKLQIRGRDEDEGD